MSHTFRSRKRERAYKLTNGHCFYCGRGVAADSEWVSAEGGGLTLPSGLLAMQVDHMEPRNFGGTLRQANVAPACPRCNAQKGAKGVEEYREWLSRKQGNPVKFFGDGL